MGIACMLVAVVVLLFASCSASASEREIQDIKIGRLETTLCCEVAHDFCRSISSRNYVERENVAKDLLQN